MAINVDNLTAEQKELFVKLKDLGVFAQEIMIEVGDLADGIEGKVDTLIGDDSGKSVRAIALEELTKQLIAEGADEKLDTLKEIADWIQAHPGDAAAMNAAIEALQAIVAGYGGEGDTYATVKAHIEAVDAAKVDKVTGKSLIDDSEITRLAGMSDGANKTEVSAEAMTAGTKVATITIDGTATDINVPAVTVSTEMTSGTKVATVTVNGTATSIYIPTASADDVRALFVRNKA